MTDPSPLTAEQIAELRRICKPLRHAPDKFGAWQNEGVWPEIVERTFYAARQWFPALLALAERPSNGECEAMAKRLDDMADDWRGSGIVPAPDTLDRAAALLRKRSGAGEQKRTTAVALETANRIIRTAPEIDPAAARVLIANIAAALIKAPK